jgi:hypothetical protein
MVNTSIHPDTQTHEEGGIWGACAGVITMNSIMLICAITCNMGCWRGPNGVLTGSDDVDLDLQILRSRDHDLQITRYQSSWGPLWGPLRGHKHPIRDIPHMS